MAGDRTEAAPAAQTVAQDIVWLLAQGKNLASLPAF